MAAAKPKIDLKARLGRKSSAPTAAGGPSVPPPGGSIAPRPIGAAPSAPAPAPAGFGPSIPPPPGFARKPAPMPSRGPAPISMAAPRASARPPAAIARPQGITVEMGEEVLEAQRRGRSKVMVLAAACVGIGLVVGFGVGKMAEAAAGADTAVMGAESLVKEIDESNIKLEGLGETLKKASDRVMANEFPGEEIEALGALEIPFSGTSLLGKGIGRFNASASTMLLQYANGVQSTLDQKEKIRRLFAAVKPQFDAVAAEKDAPTIKWAVAVTNGPKGPWAQVKMVKPFQVNDKKAKDYKWPDELEHAKGKTARYSKGEPKSDGSELMPVDPVSQANVCSENLQFKLVGALADLMGDLKGTDTPGHEKLGLIELGEKTMDQLRKIGGSR